MITFNLLNEDAKVYLPPYKGDVGFDIALPHDIGFAPGKTLFINLGISIETNMGLFAFLLPRSSWSKKGILIHTGTIDPGYTGEINCSVVNLSKDYLKIEKGKKICQLVFFRPALFKETIQIIRGTESEYFLPENYKPRLDLGFGSSGR